MCKVYFVYLTAYGKVKSLITGEYNRILWYEGDPWQTEIEEKEVLGASLMYHTKLFP